MAASGSHYNNIGICSFYLKTLERISETTFLLAGNSDSNNCGTSVALALSRAYNDPAACEAGLRVLYAVSVRRKINTLLASLLLLFFSAAEDVPLCER